MQLTIIKGALVPSSDLERMDLHKALKAAGIESKIGQSFDVQLVHPRNAKFNSKVFAALNAIAEMLGIAEFNLRAEIMYETGRGTDIKLRDGKVVTVLPSMSKTNMSEAELESFWNDAVNYIVKEIGISFDGDQQKRMREILGLDEQHNPLQGG
jgi:hypothetical protein